MPDMIQLAIPEDIENLKLPDPNLLQYYKDARDRICWIEGEIDTGALELVREILNYNKEDRGLPIEGRKPIWVVINSCGGDGQVALMIMNVILQSKTPVYTLNYFEAMSAAAYILSVGHKRYSLKGASLMVHNGEVMVGGQADSAKAAYQYFDNFSARLVKTFLDHTNISSRTYKKRAVVDWYMDEDEMLKNGIIDEIVEDFDNIL